jgi:hypothetical protein
LRISSWARSAPGILQSVEAHKLTLNLELLQLP